MRRVFGLLAGVFALALLPSFGLRAADVSDPVVAQRGAITITASQVRLLLQMADPEVRAQLEHDPALLAQRVRDRLIQLVLLDKARAEKFDENADVAFRAELAREGAIVESYVAAQTPPDPGFPTEQQVAAAYEANKARMVVPKQVPPCTDPDQRAPGVEPGRGCGGEEACRRAASRDRRSARRFRRAGEEILGRQGLRA